MPLKKNTDSDSGSAGDVEMPTVSPDSVNVEVGSRSPPARAPLRSFHGAAALHSLAEDGHASWDENDHLKPTETFDDNKDEPSKLRRQTSEPADGAGGMGTLLGARPKLSSISALTTEDFADIAKKQLAENSKGGGRQRFSSFSGASGGGATGINGLLSSLDGAGKKDNPFASWTDDDSKVGKSGSGGSGVSGGLGGGVGVGVSGGRSALPEKKRTMSLQPSAALKLAEALRQDIDLDVQKTVEEGSTKSKPSQLKFSSIDIDSVPTKRHSAVIKGQRHSVEVDASNVQAERRVRLHSRHTDFSDLRESLNMTPGHDVDLPELKPAADMDELDVAVMARRAQRNVERHSVDIDVTAASTRQRAAITTRHAGFEDTIQTFFPALPEYKRQSWPRFGTLKADTHVTYRSVASDPDSKQGMPWSKSEIRLMVGLVPLIIGFCLMYAFVGDSGHGEHHFLRGVSHDHPFVYSLDHTPREVLEVFVQAGELYRDTHPTMDGNELFLKASIMQGTGANEREVWDKDIKLREHETVYRSAVDIKKYLGEYRDEVRFVLSTNSIPPLSVALDLLDLGAVAHGQIAIGAIILLGVFALILSEKMHRTLASMLGAFVTLIILSTQGRKPTLKTVVGWMDVDTLGLLFGMMLMVGVASQTGVFEWMAIRAFKLSKGNKWRLACLLFGITGFLSALLDNVTTILLLAPVTVRLCEAVGLGDPAPYLIGEAIFSNLGGAATMIGDPPNIIIGTVLKDHIGFVDFINNLLPGVLLAIPPCLYFMKWQFKEAFEGTCEADITELEKKYVITDRPLLIKTGVVLVMVIIGFFVHPITHFDASWVAIIGAMILLVLKEVHEVEQALHAVEWETLLFFAALFVLTEGLGEMGLLRAIASALSGFVETVPVNGRLAFAMVLIDIVSAVISAFVDNIPFTATMVPVIIVMAEEVEGLDLAPLAWALSFGACLGGNATIVGSSANVVMSGVSEKAGRHISFVEFMKSGMPVACISVIVSTLYLLVRFAT